MASKSEGVGNSLSARLLKWMTVKLLSDSSCAQCQKLTNLVKTFSCEIPSVEFPQKTSKTIENPCIKSKCTCIYQKKNREIYLKSEKQYRVFNY